MTSSTLFTDAMALTAAGDGVYEGVLNEHWTIGPKVHGGAMLALCARAAQAEFDAGDDAGSTKADEAPVGAAVAPAAGLPSIHPLAVVVELVGNEDRLGVRQHALGGREELVADPNRFRSHAR